MNKKKYIVIATAVASLSASTLVSASKSYTLKGDAPTGTLIPTIEARGALPFNKSYSQLTTEQRDVYRARFQSLQADQVPPFPSKGLRDVYRPLIDANQRGISGELKLHLNINAYGRVESAHVLNSPSVKVANAAMAAVKNTRFVPGSCNGAPCAMTMPVKITYQ